MMTDREFSVPGQEYEYDMSDLDEEIAKLRAELADERAHNKRLLSQLEHWEVQRLRAALEIRGCTTDDDP